MVEREYLDTNVYCRPLDDQTDHRIRRESIAFIEIIDRASLDEIRIVSSDYVRFEIEQIHDPLKRKDVRSFERTLARVNVSGSDRLRQLARDVFERCAINALDALHMSAACLGEAEFFLTCDDAVVERASPVEDLLAQRGYRLRVRNPVSYLLERWGVEV